MARAKQDFASLSSELETVLSQLQQSDVQVDAAVKLYERGLELTEQLEHHLKQAENKIKALKLAAESAGN